MEVHITDISVTEKRAAALAIMSFLDAPSLVSTSLPVYPLPGKKSRNIPDLSDKGGVSRFSWTKVGPLCKHQSLTV